MASSIEEAVRLAKHIRSRDNLETFGMWAKDLELVASALLKLVESRKHWPIKAHYGVSYVCQECCSEWPCQGWKEGD